MSKWVLRGLDTGIKTTRYPEAAETASGISPGLPEGGTYDERDRAKLIDLCPTKAIDSKGKDVTVDYRRCVHCFRCAYKEETRLKWQPGYEWAAWSDNRPDPGKKLGAAFERSTHILVVDAGDCGACLNEVRQLNNPYYNMHRLGFFITPTPREADVLLVVGPLTDHMRVPLQKAYDAMPTPKKVVAVGSCALSGGVFGPSFVCGTGVGDLLKVDVEVPGQPPPPLAILHALLVVTGRKPAASSQWQGRVSETEGSVS